MNNVALVVCKSITRVLLFQGEEKRMCLKRKICPICKKYYNEPSALSRKDNKTKICSICGIKVALRKFIEYQKGDEK